MTRSIPQFSAGLITLMLAASLTAAASIQGSFDRTYQVTGPVELEVLTRSGDVTVNSGPAGSVVIRGKIHVGERWFSGNRQQKWVKQGPPKPHQQISFKFTPSPKR